MINQWIVRLNLILMILILAIASAAIFYWFHRPLRVENKDLYSKDYGLPKTAFDLDSKAYIGIDSPFLGLQNVPLALQVPDLRPLLLYYGKNGRPDAQTTQTLLHIALANNNKKIISMKPGEPIFLTFDRATNPPKYVFSTGNEKTSLGLITTPLEKELQVEVLFENEKGEKILEPENYVKFNIPEKEFAGFGGAPWELGSFRVDGTLLVRQRAKWFGPDRFLEHHGGEDFKNIQGKQRIDFGENDDVYSVFISLGDCLIWEENKWKVVEPGSNSLKSPLLVVKKVDDRLMSFELWDEEGRGKVNLNLLKTTEPWTTQNSQALETMFRFVGARTHSQCVFEINRERMVLSPSDWLLLTPKGWKKLCSPEEIDQYVLRKMTGTLFVFEGISRENERQIMNGTLYSPGRHDSQKVELALQSGTKSRPPQIAKNTKDNKEKELKEAKEVADLIGEILAPLNKRQEALKAVPGNNNYPASRSIKRSGAQTLRNE